MKSKDYDQNGKNCLGLNHDLKPCTHMKECDMCIWYSSPERSDYCIGPGYNGLKCKRDNPNYKPFTKEQFAVLYSFFRGKEELSFEEVFEYGQSMGLAEE